MAIIRVTELRQLKSDDLKRKLEDIELELKVERAGISTSGKPVNVGKYREMRKLRARIKTLLGYSKPGK